MIPEVLLNNSKLFDPQKVKQSFKMVQEPFFNVSSSIMIQRIVQDSKTISFVYC